MATAGKVSGLIIQALRHLGSKNVDKEIIVALKKRVSAEDRKRLIADIQHAPAWIADIFRELAKKDGEQIT